MHSGLNFKFGTDMLDFTPEKLDLTRKQLENVEVVIVDEFSMVSADNLYNLHKRLQEIFMSQEPFGGRSLLLVGDIMQLGPVRAARDIALEQVRTWKWDSHVYIWEMKRLQALLENLGWCDM